MDRWTKKKLVDMEEWMNKGHSDLNYRENPGEFEYLGGAYDGEMLLHFILHISGTYYLPGTTCLQPSDKTKAYYTVIAKPSEGH